MTRLRSANATLSLTIAAAALLTSCADRLPTADSDYTRAELARVKVDDPTVDAVDPTEAPQDTTLDLEVFGTGYDDGSTVTLKRGGKPIKEIKTNHTWFVSPENLVANITIALEADTGAYDVEVLTSRKRPGVGTEMFTVLKSNNGVGPSIEVEASEWTGNVWSPTGAVLGEITMDGRFLANTAPPSKGKNTPPAQEVCVNLSNVIAIQDQANYALFADQVNEDATSTGMASVCSEVTMHTRDHSNKGKMPGIAEGSVEYSGGKIVLKDFATGKDSWEWRIIWDAVPDYADPDATDLGQGVCIDHPDTDTWYVYNDDDLDDDSIDSCAAQELAIDNVVELWRFHSERPNLFYWVHVAEFVLPFRFKVTKL
jgi:hypothetical protein